MNDDLTVSEVDVTPTIANMVTLAQMLTELRSQYDGVLTANKVLYKQVKELDGERDRMNKNAANLEQELADVLEIAIARGNTLGFAEADNDYRKRLEELRPKEPWVVDLPDA